MKGISPIIATTILVALVISIGAIVTGWGTGLVKQVTGSTDDKTGEIIDCNVADINIENVFLNNNSKKLRVNVRNSGRTDDLSIVSGTVFNKVGNYNSTEINITDFDKGQMVAVEFGVGGVVNECYNFSKVIISSNCGKDVFDGIPDNC